jgi:putative ABC transport system permease protein
MGALLQDLKYGLRMLAKNPGFTAIAVITLGLGIAACATVFSWVDAVLLRPLPGVQNPSQVYAFETVAPNGEPLTTSYPDYRDYRDHLKLLSGLAVAEHVPLTIGEGDHAERVWGELVSGNYFAVLGVQPELGRVFLPAEYGDTPGAYPVAVISDRLWRSHFGSDPAIMGRTIRLNQYPLVIVGVAPPDFRGSVSGLVFDVWVPVMMEPQLTGVGAWMLRDRQTRQLTAIARLKPGVTLDQARAEIAELARYMASADADTNKGISATLLPLWKAHFGAQSVLLAPLEILMAVCGLVLLIVCANVGNLLLARLTARRKEFSVRLSLGAGRARLVRQILTESLVFSAAGALAGVAMTLWTGRTLGYLLPPTTLPVALDITMNGRVLVFTVLVCILTALASGLVPALQACRAGLNEALKEGGRGGTLGPQAHRVRAALVISQVSLALVALVAAGLFMRSFEASRKINPGFDMNHVLVSHFYLSTDGYNLQQRKEFCRRLQVKLESDPGVTDVSYSDIVPLGFEGNWWEDLRIEGYSPQPNENMKIWRSVVPPGYFNFMRIPLLEGRDFTEQDDEKSLPVMIINQTFARRFFPGLDPIGRRVHGWGEWFDVVGVVKDSKYGNLAERTTPYFYVPFRQVYRADMLLAFYIRTAGNFGGAAGLLRREVRGIDPNVTVFDPAPLADYIGASLYPQKIAASMLSILGGLALLLAAVGLYGAMAYSVAQRVHEIGVRMALGAKRGDVLKLVVGQGMMLTFAGALLGSIAALAATRLLTNLLYGVKPADPLTYIAVALFLIVVALIACLVPARRAANVDPMVALRYE